jgi:hypothetical protein
MVYSRLSFTIEMFVYYRWQIPTWHHLGTTFPARRRRPMLMRYYVDQPVCKHRTCTGRHGRRTVTDPSMSTVPTPQDPGVPRPVQPVSSSIPSRKSNIPGNTFTTSSVKKNHSATRSGTVLSASNLVLCVVCLELKTTRVLEMLRARNQRPPLAATWERAAV